MLTVLVPVRISDNGTGKASVRHVNVIESGYGQASVCEWPLTTYVKALGELALRKLNISIAAAALETLVTPVIVFDTGALGAWSQPRLTIPPPAGASWSSTSKVRSRLSTGPSKPTLSQANVCVPWVLNLPAL